MCGIAGIFSREIIDEKVINEMTSALAHRGPDASGIFMHESGQMALGHRRLSIIDLSAEANQPFYSSDGRFVLVFNGEIYNYQKIREELIRQKGIAFRTNSDSEVIVEAFAAWGASMVEKLEGMFAFAIIDQTDRKMFLFRDRVGKKPLFYFRKGTTFAIASEIKSLLKHPQMADRKVNRKAISKFLHLGYVPSPESVYCDVFKFPAGHIGEIDFESHALAIRPFWTAAKKITGPRVENPANARKHLAQLLHDAVEERLISDVPLGSFLSGGTDSSLITALASKISTKRLMTFNMGFQEDKFDERKYAREVAKILGTEHHEYVLTENEAMGLVEKYLDHFDEPFADTSAIPTMMISGHARKEIKAVLTGDGGDELFQGYGSYTWADRLASGWWKAFRQPVRLACNASGLSRYQRVAHLLEHAKEGGLRSHIFSQEQYFFSQHEIHSGLLRNTSEFCAFEYEDPVISNLVFSEGEKQALFDLQYYLQDDLLVKVDRASMYYALECRCPLLDHRVIEYAFSLDGELKKKRGKTKWILKKLLYDYIPKALVDRPKWGFSVPLSKWLQGELRYLMDDYLNDKVIDEVGLLNKGYVNTLKHEFLSGKDYFYNRLWVIIVLHKWFKKNA